MKPWSVWHDPAFIVYMIGSAFMLAFLATVAVILPRRTCGRHAQASSSRYRCP